MPLVVLWIRRNHRKEVSWKDHSFFFFTTRSSSFSLVFGWCAPFVLISGAAQGWRKDSGTRGALVGAPLLSSCVYPENNAKQGRGEGEKREKEMLSRSHSASLWVVCGAITYSIIPFPSMSFSLFWLSLSTKPCVFSSFIITILLYFFHCCGSVWSFFFFFCVRVGEVWAGCAASWLQPSPSPPLLTLRVCVNTLHARAHSHTHTQRFLYKERGLLLLHRTTTNAHEA